MKSARLSLTLAALAAPALIAGAILGGCETTSQTDRAAVAPAPASISMTASNRQIVTGEVTTFSVASENTLGRDAQVEWTTTGGELRTEDNGRIARAMFNQPGAYTITAVLLLDGIEVDRDSVTINVRPLR